MRRSLRYLAFVTASGCGPSLDLGSTGQRAPLGVSVEPAGTLEQAPPVFRLRVAGALDQSPLADFRLLRGELSSYHLGRLRQRELPGTLLEREVPSAVWGDGADVIVAPAEVLSPGPLSLASPELGLIAEIGVDATPAPVLRRLWPPPDQRVGRGVMIFCGEGASGLGGATLALAPAGVTAAVRPGLGVEGVATHDCVRLEPEGEVPDGALLLPPALLDGVAFEPLPLVGGSVPVPGVPCELAELPLGPACVLVQDDRLRLRAPASPSFWVLSTPAAQRFVLTPGRSAVVRGLTPGRASRITGTAFDLEGRSETIDREVLAAPAMPHVVLNEVMANPVGAERTSEWVELVNDGRERVELGGLELRDATGVARLPDAVLEPGELALIVAEGFAPDPELDLTAPEGVLRLVVPALGSGGLANGGEPLRLLDREGSVLSRFPALAAKKAGQSVARVIPDAPDDEAASFGAHAGPGASPGLPNVIVTGP